MTTSRKLLCTVYAAIAVAALIATWSQNLAYVGPGHGISDFMDFWTDTRANPASQSITADLMLFGLAALVFMVFDARKLGVRYVWVYILVGFVTAISIVFPLYLIVRERRLAATGETLPKLPTVDKLGLGLLTLTVAAFVVWVDLG